MNEWGAKEQPVVWLLLAVHLRFKGAHRLDQKIQPLSDKEKEWVAIQLQGASKLVAIYLPAEAGKPLTLATLDAAFAAWTQGNETKVDIINAVINRVGIAFGQILVDGIGFEWVIATDEHGSDLAILALPGKGDVLMYPANFVSKRWERRETCFLEKSYDKTAQQIRIMQQK